MELTHLKKQLSGFIFAEKISAPLDDKYSLRFSTENDRKFIPHASVRDNLEKFKENGGTPISFFDVLEKIADTEVYSLVLTDEPSEGVLGNYWRVAGFDTNLKEVTLVLCDEPGLYAYSSVEPVKLPFDHVFFTKAFLQTCFLNGKSLTLEEAGKEVKKPNVKIIGNREEIH